MARWTIADRIRFIAEDVRRHGPRALLREIWLRFSPARRAAQRRKVAEDRTFDARGYHTMARVSLDGLDIAGDAATSRHHEAVPVALFATIVRALDIPLETATFVDLGSGMGRALLLAAEQPFASIVGIEFARELHEIAVDNFRIRARREGADPRINLLHANAADYEMPAGPLVVFLFNPFGPPVLRPVLGRLRASWLADERPIRIVYVNVHHADEVAAAGFEELKVADDFQFVIYQPGAGADTSSR